MDKFEGYLIGGCQTNADGKHEGFCHCVAATSEEQARRELIHWKMGQGFPVVELTVVGVSQMRGAGGEEWQFAHRSVKEVVREKPIYGDPDID